MSDAAEAARPTCFVAMPITTNESYLELHGDPRHWHHVAETLFVPAIEAAGMEPILPLAEGSDLVHSNIVRRLVSTDMVLCDLSSANPNVYFEFGIRTALNKPVALVAEEGSFLPFDVGIMNTLFYQPTLRAWDMAGEIDRLKDHLGQAVRTCKGVNPLWQKFGLDLQATGVFLSVEASQEDARFSLILERLATIESTINRVDRGRSESTTAFVVVDSSRGLRSGKAAREAAQAIERLELPGVFGVRLEEANVVRVYMAAPDDSVERAVMDLARKLGVLPTFTYGRRPGPAV